MVTIEAVVINGQRRRTVRIDSIPNEISEGIVIDRDVTGSANDYRVPVLRPDAVLVVHVAIENEVRMVSPLDTCIIPSSERRVVESAGVSRTEPLPSTVIFDGTTSGVATM